MTLDQKGIEFYQKLPKIVSLKKIEVMSELVGDQNLIFCILQGTPCTFKWISFQPEYIGIESVTTRK